MSSMVSWQPGFQQPVSLMAGPSFARYYGTLSFDGPPPPFIVLPYIDGVLCGVDMSAMSRGGGPVSYHVIVDPAELRGGCGQSGAQVTLRLQVEGGLDAVIDVVPWETGGLVHRPNVMVDDVATDDADPVSTP